MSCVDCITLLYWLFCEGEGDRLLLERRVCVWFYGLPLPLLCSSKMRMPLAGKLFPICFSLSIMSTRGMFDVYIWF